MTGMIIDQIRGSRQTMSAIALGALLTLGIAAFAPRAYADGADLDKLYQARAKECSERLQAGQQTMGCGGAAQKVAAPIVAPSAKAIPARLNVRSRTNLQ